MTIVSSLRLAIQKFASVNFHQSDDLKQHQRTGMNLLLSKLMWMHAYADHQIVCEHWSMLLLSQWASPFV